MTENAVLKSESMSLEAAASWNTRYLTPDGFVCQLTLRGETGKDLLERANSALAYLRASGFIPVDSYRPSNSILKPPSNGNGNGSGKEPDHSPDWCPIHNCQMKKYEKNGKSWYSHKTDSGWCRGKE